MHEAVSKKSVRKVVAPLSLVVVLFASLALSGCSGEKSECDKAKDYFLASRDADRKGLYVESARLGNLYTAAQDKCDAGE